MFIPRLLPQGGDKKNKVQAVQMTPSARPSTLPLRHSRVRTEEQTTLLKVEQKSGYPSTGTLTSSSAFFDKKDVHPPSTLWKSGSTSTACRKSRRMTAPIPFGESRMTLSSARRVQKKAEVPAGRITTCFSP